MSDTWHNWMGNLTCRPAHVCKPCTLAGLQDIVRRARHEGRRVRAFGARHSWMPLVPTDDYLIDNTDLNRCLRVDCAARTITVEAGMRLERLTEIAEQHQMMLPSPTVHSRFTVGGMVATGSAGTGMQTQTFSDAVVGCTIVCADGTAVEVSASDPDFAALRVSLGTLGVFYSLTFQCLPARNMRNRDRVLPLADVLDDLPRLVKRHYGVMLMWYPYTDKAWVKTYDPVVNTPVDYGWWRRTLEEIGQYVVQGGLSGVGKVLLQRLPSLTPLFLQMVIAITRNRDYVESPLNTFHFQYVYPLCWDSSWAIPVARAQEAWRAFIDTIDAFRKREIYPINLVVALRFTRQSEALLSPDYGRDSCFIEATTFKGTAGAEALFCAIEEIMIERFDGRPHWAKMWYDMPRVQERYRQQLEQFASIRQRWDPNGMFLNDFLAALFAPFAAAVAPAA